MDPWNNLSFADRAGLLYKEAFVDPDKIIPAGLIGGALGFGAGRLTAPKPKSLMEHIEDKATGIKDFAKKEWKNPDVRTGVYAAGGVGGAAVLYAILKAHADKQRAEQRPQRSRRGKYGSEKQAFIAGWAGKLIDNLLKRTGKAITAPIHSPVQTAKAVGRGAQNVYHRGVRPAYDVFKKYTGLATLGEEANLGKLLARHPQLGQDWQTVSAHLAARGVSPTGGLFKTYFNLPGSITEKLTNTGKMRWFLENYKDPAKLQQLMHGADPKTIDALQRVAQFKVPTSKMVKDPVKGWTRQNTGDQFLHQRIQEKSAPSLGISLGIPAALIAPGLLQSDPDALNREVETSPFRSPFAPKAQPNFIQRGMGAAGDAVAPFSPGLGNFMREHPYASAGIGAAGLGGLGYMGYRGLRGSDA